MGIKFGYRDRFFALVAIFLCTMVILSGPVQAAPLVYAEPPDLTPNLAIPDDLGPLDIGINTISGTTDSGPGPIPSGDDADSFQYSIPAGMAATSFELIISNFAATDGNFGVMRTFSGGTLYDYFFGDITYPNVIDTASGNLASGTYDFQVYNAHLMNENPPFDALGTVSYSWEAVINVVADTDVDIELGAAASIDPVVAGSGPDNLIVTLTAVNNGPADATGLVVDTTWVLPAGVTPTSYVPSQGSVDPSGVWTIGDLTVAQGTVSLVATLTVGPDTVAGTDVISGSASVSAVDQNDWDPANDTITDAVSVRETSATFRIAKEYSETVGPAVDVQLTCNDVLIDSGSVANGEFVSLSVNGFLQDGFGTTNCSVTETVPTGYAPGYSADCNVVAVDGAANATDGEGVYACTIVNDVSQANFHVTKTFSDDSVHDVDVEITCNNGLPLKNSATITSGDPAGVTFVVTNFTDGAMDCEIVETSVTPGYEPSAGCSFPDVSSGDYDCELTNAAEDGMFTVNMDWVVPVQGGNEINMNVPVTITCNAEITPSTDDYDGEWWYDTVLGDGDYATVSVDTSGGTAECWAEQDLGDLSGIESEDDCGAQDVAAGEDVSCTFTNTVFFEGIPTLSQYGLAILVLLTLGVGLVGFRRFA